MRDVRRIPGALRSVERVWEKYPDLRLGQLLWALAKGDPFYIEESALIARATEVYANGWDGCGPSRTYCTYTRSEKPNERT